MQLKFLLLMFANVVRQCHDDDNDVHFGADVSAGAGAGAAECTHYLLKNPFCGTLSSNSVFNEVMVTKKLESIVW